MELSKVNATFCILLLCLWWCPHFLFRIFFTITSANSSCFCCHYHRSTLDLFNSVFFHPIPHFFLLLSLVIPSFSFFYSILFWLFWVRHLIICFCPLFYWCKCLRLWFSVRGLQLQSCGLPFIFILVFPPWHIIF